MGVKDRGRYEGITNQRYTPTLSTCAVARKSLVGENAMLVATLDVRKASMRRPVGTSNVLMVESRDAATSHLASGENACMKVKLYTRKCKVKYTHYIQDPTAEATKLTDDPSGLNINNTNYEVVAYDCQETAVIVERN